MQRTVNILYWNACGVQNQIAELRVLAERLKADAILICETHLSKLNNLKIPNYVTYRDDRAGAGRAYGGTAILVKRNLQHMPVAKPHLNTVEATTVIVKIGGVETLLVAAYNRPSLTLDTGDLDRLLSVKTPAIIAGDLNAKHGDWNSRVNNQKGVILQAYASERDIAVVAPVEPTHYHHANDGDVLDVAILAGVTSGYGVWSLPELDSDHNPCLLRLTDSECDLRAPAQRLNVKIDWDEYTSALENMAVEGVQLETTMDIDSAVENLTRSIQETLTSCSTTTRRVSDFRQIPTELSELIKRKNRVRRIWQRYRDPADKRRLNALQHQVRDRVRAHRDRQWDDVTVGMTLADKSVWQISRRLTKTSPVSPALVSDNGTNVYDSEGKAELFAATLEEQFTTNPIVKAAENEYVEECVNRFFEEPTNQLHSPVSSQEVKGIIRRLKRSKAPGIDAIGNQAFKRLPENVVELVVNIFNGIYKLAYFPRAWKQAKVIMIPKPGKQLTRASSYRPISLLNGLSKVFERTLQGRLNDHIVDNDIVINEQFGFRSQHSTTQQVLRLTEFVTRGFNERRHSGAIFIDIEKAFDKVWHTGLYYKLFYYKLPDCYIRLVRSYLTDRSFIVSCEDVSSTPRPIRAGVPQGSVIGPTLFSVYVNDIPREGNLAMYADDTAIFTQSWQLNHVAMRLQAQLQDLEDYYSMWRIKVNVQKCEGIIFSRRRTVPLAPLQLYDAPIPWKDNAKYLGVTLDKRLNFRKHTDTVLAKATGQFARLYPLINARSKLSLDVKRLLYLSCIRPIITYAGPAWMYEPSCKKRVQIFQNKRLRFMTGAHFFVRNATLHRDLQVDTVAQFVLRQAEKLYDVAESHDNPLIRGLGHYDPHNPYYRHKRPRLALEA